MRHTILFPRDVNSADFAAKLNVVFRCEWLGEQDDKVLVLTLLMLN